MNDFDDSMHLGNHIKSYLEESIERPVDKSRVIKEGLLRGRRRVRRRQGIAVALSCLLVLVVAVSVSLTTRTIVEPTNHLPETMNMLIIGSDYDSSRTGQRADTIILAHINTRTGAVVLISLPRNLGRVPFPPGTPGRAAWPNGFWCPNKNNDGLNDCLLNAVWGWAESDSSPYRGENRGWQATRDAVAGALDVRVSGYLALNMDGFQQLVDALGGVRINVDERLPIGGSPLEPEATGGWLNAGDNQLLNGKQALWFVRSRWSTDDYDRVRRARCMLAALTQQIDTRKLIVRFSEISRILGSNVQTDISPSDVGEWFDVMQRMQSARVVSLAFTGKEVGDSNNPDFDAIQNVVETALESSDRGPADSERPDSDVANLVEDSGDVDDVC